MLLTPPPPDSCIRESLVRRDRKNFGGNPNSFLIEISGLS
jgi:hypothetical protein